MSKNKSSTNSTVVIVPALITAIAGIVAAYFSYSAGVSTVRIPLQATQTAEAASNSGISRNNVEVNKNSGTSGIPIAIDATSSWQYTGITASIGDVVSIEVVGGKWTASRVAFPEGVMNQMPAELKKELFSEIYMNEYYETAGSGNFFICEAEDQCPMKGYKVGGLIARIGNLKYFIGSKCTFRVIDSGKIYLQINDFIDKPNNNFGVLAVEVNIDNTVNPIVSEECGIPTP